MGRFKMKKYIFMVLLFCVTTLAFSSNIQEKYTDVILNEKQQKILVTVINVDGYITKELYDEFWKDIRGTDDEEKMKNQELFIPEGHKIQLIIWQSAKKSLEQKKVYISKELEDVLALLKKRNYMPSYNNTLTLLNATANGEKANVRGYYIYITKEVIDEVLNGLNASIDRMRLLLASSWNPKSNLITSTKTK